MVTKADSEAGGINQECEISRYTLCCAVLSHSILSNSVTPLTIAHQQFCPWGFSRQENWSRLPCPPPGHLPNPGIEPRSPAFYVDSLQSEPPGKPKNAGVGSLSPEPGIESGSPALQMDSLPAKPREAQLHTAIYKIDKQQGLTEYPREQYSIS